MKNLKKHLTLSALFVAGTMLSYTAHAEDINVSNISKLIEAIAKSGTNTANLQNDISATTPTTSFGCLGELKGTLTINGGTSKYGISGSYGTNSHYEGITVGSAQKLFVENVGLWKGFSNITTDIGIYAGAIYNWQGTVGITGSTFSENYSRSTISKYPVRAYGGAIFNFEGALTITGSTFSKNYSSADGSSGDAIAYGGAIYNDHGTVTITDSTFSENYGSAVGGDEQGVYVRGGAICNNSVLNIIANTKDSVFSGNYTEVKNYTKVNGTRTNNDIYNSKTTNLYAASGKTISFGGGIVGTGSSSVNINVNDETTYDVAGTVLFKTGSINSSNNFTLGAGTLKLESGVSWTNNSLTQTGGILNLQNNAIETTAFIDFNSSGGTVDIDIDLAMGTADEINVTGTLTKAAEIGNINFITTNIADTTKSIAIGNGLHLTGRKDIVSETTLANNYIKVWLAQSETISNSLDVVRFQSINAAISDSSTTTREISLIQNVSATANLGRLAGTQLTIDGGENTRFGISGTYETYSHYEGITVGSEQKLIINNVGSVDANGNIEKSWNGFARSAYAYTDAFASGGAIYNFGKTTITGSSFSKNYAYARGGAIYNNTGTVEISNSSFSDNYASTEASTEASANGGAIYNNTGTVEISNSSFSNNYADAYAKANGGAIYNSEGGTVEITDSSFSDNYASTEASTEASANGGAIYNSEGGTVEITGSTFSENHSSAGSLRADAIAYGGAISNVGTATITGSSFSKNYAFAYASDANANANGGAICNSGVLTITDSSFSNNYVSADGTSDARGGAIYNVGTATITDSSFSNNSAFADARGGAIYNGSIVNIIASTKDSVFSGNYTEVNGRKTNNDIYNSGTTNLYAASGKTISFDGGIVSAGTSVNINVKGEASYDVAGTVLFKNGSINSGNHFTLGAGTLKIENGVSWRNNSLVMNGGTLDIGSSDTDNIGTLEYNGGSLTLNTGANINIDISGTTAGTEHDKIAFSNNAEFILKGGKITVDLGDNIVVGSTFKVLEKFTWNGTETEFSDLVKLNNNPSNWSEAYSLIAKISLDESGSGSSLFIEVIPEPSMFGLFAGLAALALVGTRRRRK